MRTIAQESNLEQVISPEMPRIVSPEILERDIEPSFYRWVPPVHGHVRRLNNFGCSVFTLELGLNREKVLY